MENFNALSAQSKFSSAAYMQFFLLVGSSEFSRKKKQFKKTRVQYWRFNTGDVQFVDFAVVAFSELCVSSNRSSSETTTTDGREDGEIITPMK